MCCLLGLFTRTACNVYYCKPLRLGETHRRPRRHRSEYLMTSVRLPAAISPKRLGKYTNIVDNLFSKRFEYFTRVVTEHFRLRNEELLSIGVLLKTILLSVLSTQGMSGTS